MRRDRALGESAPIFSLPQTVSKGEGDEKHRVDGRPRELELHPFEPLLGLSPLLAFPEFREGQLSADIEWFDIQLC